MYLDESVVGVLPVAVEPLALNVNKGGIGLDFGVGVLKTNFLLGLWDLCCGSADRAWFPYIRRSTFLPLASVKVELVV